MEYLCVKVACGMDVVEFELVHGFWFNWFWIWSYLETVGKGVQMDMDKMLSGCCPGVDLDLRLVL